MNGEEEGEKGEKGEEERGEEREWRGEEKADMLERRLGKTAT